MCGPKNLVAHASDAEIGLRLAVKSLFLRYQIFPCLTTKNKATNVPEQVSDWGRDIEWASEGKTKARPIDMARAIFRRLA
jgi:hypothetical protein